MLKKKSLESVELSLTRWDTKPVSVSSVMSMTAENVLKKLLEVTDKYPFQVLFLWRECFHMQKGDNARKLKATPAALFYENHYFAYAFYV